MPTPQLPRFDRSPANWTGPQLAASPERWIHDLTAGEIADIDPLLARHGRREDDLTNLTRSEAEMPTLGPGFAATKPSARGYQTAERLSYHTDSSDVVGLLSLRTAKSGGLSSAVSSTAIYHVLLDRHPDLLAVLLEPTW